MVSRTAISSTEQLVETLSRIEIDAMKLKAHAILSFADTVSESAAFLDLSGQKRSECSHYLDGAREMCVGMLAPSTTTDRIIILYSEAASYVSNVCGLLGQDLSVFGRSL